MFQDRRDAGRQLAAVLTPLRGQLGLLVLGLPRGGVPVAFEVARALGAPLDVFTVRKLGLPGHEELAMGALAPGGLRVMNAEVLDHFRVPEATIEAVAEREGRELMRREALYRAGRPPLELRGRAVLLIDDGLATGASMRAAVRAVREKGAAWVMVAVPIGSREACGALRAEVDTLCLHTPGLFSAVGQGYRDFGQTGDAEVQSLLAESAAGEEA